MDQELIIAGFGGQGIMLAGQLLAHAGMLEGKKVSWIPSYGPEMRGGTANCSVVISAGEVASPIVSEPKSLIIMNKPSLTRFEPALGPRGLLVYNSSLVDTAPARTDIHAVKIPASEVAAVLGEPRVANMVMVGAYLAIMPVVKMSSILESLKEVLPARRHNLIPLNKAALEKGAALATGVARAGAARKTGI